MLPKVLVVADTPALRDFVDLMLFGRATVVWSPTPNETEGLGTTAVVLDGSGGRENLAQVRVHPQLSDVPVIWIGGFDADALGDVRVVDSSGADAVRQLHDVLEGIVMPPLVHSAGQGGGTRTSVPAA